MADARQPRAPAEPVRLASVTRALRWLLLVASVGGVGASWLLLDPAVRPVVVAGWVLGCAFGVVSLLDRLVRERAGAVGAAAAGAGSARAGAEPDAERRDGVARSDRPGARVRAAVGRAGRGGAAGGGGGPVRSGR